MKGYRFYYDVKPFLPWRIRMALRRRIFLKNRASVRGIWPIRPGSERPPPHWPGWPDGKQFALVLTHDVEGAPGVERCRDIVELEKSRGFHSSFNFVPEGSYEFPRELRDHLNREGFEIGVHDLRHDGKLYQSRAEFKRFAGRINGWLKEWNVVGFRSAFMHRNLEWLKDLQIEYDASTFDTDPFEPQPYGVDTIFPFWVPNSPELARVENTSPARNGAVQWEPTPAFGAGLASYSPGGDTLTLPSRAAPAAGAGMAPRPQGYVELPYTLPQDSTLFLIFRERTIETWRQKLDWIAQHGGMALVNVHPDYMNFNGRKCGPREYPAALYQELLDYVREKYRGQFWNPLPREMAAYVREIEQQPQPRPGRVKFGQRIVERESRARIWVDLDNTPHVPFFLPILRELEERGYQLLCTARDAFQVADLAAHMALPVRVIGRHSGRRKLAKLAGLFYRAAQLLPTILHEKPELAISHGSRSQLLLANLLGIPTVLIDDYEHSSYPPLMRPKWEIVPNLIASDLLPCAPHRVRRYPGIKEDVYVRELRRDPALLNELGVGAEDLLVTVRPPATEAHYHHPASERLFAHAMNRLCATPAAKVVLLPRNQHQANSLRAAHPHWFGNGHVVVPRQAVDGLNLLWHSDLMISGGGTMNREAAALNVPAYTIFRGKLGAVDQFLESAGRLTILRSAAEFDRDVKLVRRPKAAGAALGNPDTLRVILDHIEEIISLDSVSCE